MISSSSPKRRRAAGLLIRNAAQDRIRFGRSAFTLLELLLVLLLVLLLSGLVIVNFEPAYRSATAQEGIERVRTLFQLIRSEAALRQRRFLIQLRTGAELERPIGRSRQQQRPPIISVFWEPDPFTQPGVFVPFIHPLIEDTDWGSHFRILRVAVEPAGIAVPIPIDTDGRTTQFVSEQVQEQVVHAYFMPDGTSDSVTLVLAPADALQDIEEGLVYRISYEGLTGTVLIRAMTARAWLEEEQEVASWEEQAPNMEDVRLK